MTDDGGESLLFTVGTVWREARVSCPHPDILRAWLADGLEQGAAEFLRFHLEESQCPYCAATIEDFKAREQVGKQCPMTDLRDKLMRSTVAALRKAR